MFPVAALSTFVLFVILLIALDNAWAFPRLQPQPRIKAGAPSVSVLIPARNEAAVIAESLQGWLLQKYDNLEILVLDDHSEDATAEIVCAQAKQARHIRLLKGAALPAGWSGKNWACHQLAQHAQNDILLFTDADVAWQPSALAAVVEEMERTAADLFTVWPTQLTVTWAERLVVPLMSYAVLAYLPVQLAHCTRLPLTTAANGQCVAFRRQAYAACGGHAAVRSSVLDDVQLAQRCKRAGLRLRMADGAGLVSARMYHNWPETLYGYAKNILAGHANSIALLLASTVVHLSLFVVPWVWLAAGLSGLTSQDALGWPLLLIALGWMGRTVTAITARQRPGDALLMPVSVLLMTRIALQSIWWQLRYGGPLWKGRLVGSDKQHK